MIEVVEYQSSPPSLPDSDGQGEELRQEQELSALSPVSLERQLSCGMLADGLTGEVEIQVGSPLRSLPCSICFPSFTPKFLVRTFPLLDSCMLLGRTTRRPGGSCTPTWRLSTRATIGRSSAPSNAPLVGGLYAYASSEVPVDPSGSGAERKALLRDWRRVRLIGIQQVLTRTHLDRCRMSSGSSFQDGSLRLELKDLGLVVEGAG